MNADLRPRAVAVLCALRLGARSLGWIDSAIGNDFRATTRTLLEDMASMKLVATSTTGQCHLTHDGIGWCESNGMSVGAGALDAASWTEAVRS